MRLATKERMPYEEVFKLCKGDKATGAAPVPEWDYKRTGAKVFSFQRAYGAGAQKISDSTGIPLEEVEALILAEEERYPEITEYAEAISASLKANRRPAGIAVPHPTVPGIMCNLGVAHYRTPDGKLYSYQEQPAPEFVVKRGTFANFSPTEIKNYVVQGTGGEWAKAAMWLAIRAFYARRNFEHRALIVNQVHDAVYADAHQDVAADAAALLHACMEGASDFMEWYFNWEIPVPVPSDTTWGASMMDENPVPQVKENAQQLRKELRALYMGGFTPSFAAKQGTA
jgi:DNA polymerase I-like protein with 3'-5' exonuclease and polymerase domains